MLDLGTLVGYLDLDTSDFERGLRVSERKVKDWGQQAGRSAEQSGRQVGDGLSKGIDGRLRTANGRFAKAGGDAGQKFGGGLTSGLKGGLAGLTAVGGAGLAAGGLVAFGLAKAVSKAGAFDKSMRQVSVQTGVTGRGLQEMTDLAIRMGAESSFSAQGASDAMLELAKGGLTAAQMKAGALAETLTLATAGGLDLGSAASYMVQGLTSFGLEADQAGEVAAALAGAANASTASVESMGQALSQVGAGAKVAGLSIQDTTAALAAFDNAGVKGSDAGTALKTLLVRLVPDTEKASGAMRDLGLITEDGGNQFFDASGKMKSMAEVSQLLQDSLRGQSQQQKIATLNTIFGSDASRAAAILADNGAKGLAKYVTAVNDQAAAQDLANSATKGYSGALEKFQGAVETAQIQLGTKFLPIITQVLGYLSDAGIPTFQAVSDVITSAFAPAISGAQGSFTSFIDYLATHQADVIKTFQAGGNAVLDFAVAVAQMSAAGLRQLGDFAVNGTRAVLGMVGALLRSFDSIPGVDMSESIAEFDRVAVAADQGAAKTQNSLYETATAIDRTVIPGIDRLRSRFNDAANTEITKAEQRDALERTSRAIDKVGTKADGAQLYLKRFADRSKLSADEQRGLDGRLNKASRALGEQLEAARQAGAGQKDLTRTWEEGKKKLYDEFVQMGLSKKEAQKLADKYAGIKPKVSTKIETPGMSAAQTNAKKMKDRVNDIPNSKTVTGRLNFTTNASGVVANLNKQFQLVKGGPRMTLAKGGAANAAARRVQHLAYGGAVQDFSGRGRQSYDTEEALLRVDEHVWTPEEVDGAGGHGEVKRLRTAARRGMLHFAAGGGVPSLAGPDAAHSRANVRGVDSGAQMMAFAIRAQLNMLRKAIDQAGPASAGKIDVSNARGTTSYRGGTFSNLFAANLRRAERIAGQSLSVYQGGFRPSTSYSGTSHRGDAIDNQASASIIRALRAVGIASGDRTGLGNWMSHAHGVPTPGAGYAGGSAVWQAQDYLRRGGARQGLRSPWGLYTGTDSATPGFHWTGEKMAELVVNPQMRQYSGGEMVLNGDETLRALRGGGSGGGDINITVQSKDNLREDLREVAWQMKMIKRGGLHRTGAR